MDDTFLNIFSEALGVILVLMTLLWVVSVLLRNASIVDPFWGAGFVLVCFYYFMQVDSHAARHYLILALTTIWGLRLSLFLAWRNSGKGEDFRYRQFRQDYGPERYWWISFFQVFLLQGILMWLISATLLGAQFPVKQIPLNLFDILGIGVWLVGIVFEAGSDWQLARFKRNPANKGKLVTTGFWRFTRHPNYFGDSAVWWGYGLICLANGSYLPVLGAVLMTLLILRISGVPLLEESLRKKPGYAEYARRTSAFLPWFPTRS